jgi:predicted CXXCH cytochrome family protein
MKIINNYSLVVVFTLFGIILCWPNYSDAAEIDHFGTNISSSDPAKCLDCHGSDTGQDSSGASNSCSDSIKNSHPINVDFPPAGKEKLFKSAVELGKAGIILNKGQITCLSCHNLQKNTPKNLVIENNKSKLCLTCHNL